jgi:hypothetical protein
VLVSVSLPVMVRGKPVVKPNGGLDRPSNIILSAIEKLANRFGGRNAGTSHPEYQRCGTAGYETFGASYAFEAGDVNISSFIHFVKRDYPQSQVDYNEEDVLGPDEDEVLKDKTNRNHTFSFERMR